MTMPPATLFEEVDPTGRGVFTRPRWQNIVWDIMGEGEKDFVFFGGSMAEATDDALTVAEAVLFHGITTFAEWEKYADLL